MKKLISIVLVTVMLLALMPLTVFATTEGTEGLRYNLSYDETYYIVWEYTGSATMVVIPSEYNGKPVKEIGNRAFSHCDDLTSISIPSSVTTIGVSAFSYCDSLRRITIPDSVTTIDEYAFFYCLDLTNLTIGNSVTTIGERAFSWCTSLTNIAIPDSVTTIGDYAFQECYNLTSITIPDSVTTIGKRTFSSCYNLTSVTIPDSVTTIGDYAFYDCYNLTSVTIPDSVTTIGNHAFYLCRNLTSVTIGNSVTTIGVGAFSYCDSLTSVTIPDSVTNIGSGAFSYCDSLTSITIPDSVTTIGAEAFYGCDGLTSVTIPDSVTTIGDYAFECCANLTSINIPNSVTRIGEGAFYDCESLTSVTILDSVTTIGFGAFYGCDNLTDIYCEAESEPDGWDKDWDDGCYATVHWGYKPAPVKITTQPKSVAVQSGKTAKVTVTATGDGLKYKWYFKNKGASSFSLTTTFTGNTYSAVMNSTRAGCQVYCVITDKYGATVKTNTVTLGMVVKITKQPTNVSVQSGKTAKVTVFATGEGLAYKWYFKNKGDSKFTLTNSYKSNTYSLEMNGTRAGRQIYCVITDKYGNEVKTKTVTLGMAVKITKQPTTVSVQSGKQAKVTVSASGEGKTYKWYYKDKNATKFTLTNSFKGDSYYVEMNGTRAGRQVYCVITDKYGNSVKTNTVTLGMAVKITKQPTSVKVYNGKTAKVSVTATGEGRTYKWYFKDKGSSKFYLTTSFKGATYSVTMTNARAGRQVYCIITDKYGNSVKTNTVTLNKK